MYYAEGHVPPDVFSSIPASPVTLLGKVIASVVMLTGIGLIAVRHARLDSITCPWCVSNHLIRAANQLRRERLHTAPRPGVVPTDSVLPRERAAQLREL